MFESGERQAAPEVATVRIIRIELIGAYHLVVRLNSN